MAAMTQFPAVSSIVWQGCIILLFCIAQAGQETLLEIANMEGCATIATALMENIHVVQVVEQCSRVIETLSRDLVMRNALQKVDCPNLISKALFMHRSSPGVVYLGGKAHAGLMIAPPKKEKRSEKRRA